MILRRWLIIIWSMLIAAGLAACSTTVTPEPDRIATRVAEDLAVAATLTAQPRTAEAAVPVSPTAQAATPTASPTVPPAASPAPPPPTPAPSIDPIVPGFGNPKGLSGRIALPGYQGPVDTPVFRDSIVFKLIVNDPNVADQDGAGIKSVSFEITGPNGTVHAQVDRQAAYCVFGGGEPDCPVWNFVEHNNQWPNGTPVCVGNGYQVQMVVETDDPINAGANWGFNFGIEGDYPSCQ